MIEETVKDHPGRSTRAFSLPMCGARQWKGVEEVLLRRCTEMESRPQGREFLRVIAKMGDDRECDSRVCTQARTERHAIAHPHTRRVWSVRCGGGSTDRTLNTGTPLSLLHRLGYRPVLEGQTGTEKGVGSRIPTWDSDSHILKRAAIDITIGGMMDSRTSLLG